ncbi:MAG: ribosomal protein S18-alanine N-acetyltransferase [Anaerolineales bacterium]|jgi:ribosomal-protein-alanine N-acetyltransferase
MDKGSLNIRKMEMADIPSVLEIDRQSFPVPWSERTYRLEISGNPSAHFMVAEVEAKGTGRVVGYIGYWLIVDEAHISTLAVARGMRRRKVGSRLLRAALRSAARKGAERVSLEVRESNHGAIKLYERHGFTTHSKKPEYYRDNDEDAVVMILYDLVKKLEGVREV